MAPRAIRDLENLGLREWQWSVGNHDFHAHFDDVISTWVLERFDSRIQDPNQAHVDEVECESLEDALLSSLE